MVVRIRLTRPSLHSAWMCLRKIPTFAIVTTGMVLIGLGTSNAPAAPPAPRIDTRIARLAACFHRYRCPEPQHIALYLRSADRYGLDYRMLPAISIRETQCGVREKENNRLGFQSVAGGFASVEAGIAFM